jgi:hypothetical protein
METRIGYFKNLVIKADNVFEAYDKLPLYKDYIPKEEDGDCYRVTIIDGALFIEIWESGKKDFAPIVCTNHFTIKF